MHLKFRLLLLLLPFSCATPQVARTVNVRLVEPLCIKLTSMVGPSPKYPNRLIGGADGIVYHCDTHPLLPPTIIRELK